MNLKFEDLKYYEVPDDIPTYCPVSLLRVQSSNLSIFLMKAHVLNPKIDVRETINKSSTIGLRSQVFIILHHMGMFLDAIHADYQPPAARFFESRNTVLGVLHDVCAMRLELDSVDAEFVRNNHAKQIKIKSNFNMPPVQVHSGSASKIWNYWTVPQIYFHMSVVYNTLKRCGVELEKENFIGNIRHKLIKKEFDESFDS